MVFGEDEECRCNRDVVEDEESSEEQVDLRIKLRRLCQEWNQDQMN